MAGEISSMTGKSRRLEHIDECDMVQKRNSNLQCALLYAINLSSLRYDPVHVFLIDIVPCNVRQLSHETNIE